MVWCAEKQPSQPSRTARSLPAVILSPRLEDCPPGFTGRAYLPVLLPIRRSSYAVINSPHPAKPDEGLSIP